MKSFEKDIRRHLLNYHDGIGNLKLDRFIRPTVLDTGIKYSFSTGTWGLKTSLGSNHVGASQQLARINNRSALSSLRRVMTTIDKTGGKAVMGPRKLHSTHWGMVCPSETPDGDGIGINKNLALTCYITNFEDPAPVVAHLDDMVYLEAAGDEDLRIGTKVHLNGLWLGVTHAPFELVERLRRLRRNGLLHLHTTIVWRISYREIQLFTDAGRLVRPLYIVDDNKPRITQAIFDQLASGALKWQQLLGVGDATTNAAGLDEAVIEYLDSMEVEQSMIAMTAADLAANSKENAMYMEFTHMELHPAMLFGTIISDVPFANHNQAPRVIYYGQHGRQALGIYATNFRCGLLTVSCEFCVARRGPVAHAPALRMPAGTAWTPSRTCCTTRSARSSPLGPRSSSATTSPTGRMQLWLSARTPDTTSAKRQTTPLGPPYPG